MTKAEQKRREAVILKIYSECPNGHKADGVFRSGDLWAVCSYARFVRVKDRPDGIVECVGVNLDSIIPETLNSDDEIIPPTKAEIKAIIKERGLTPKKNCKAIEALPGWWCNPFFLIDMLDAMPEAVWYKPSGWSAPLYAKAEDGDALLMPCRPPEA